MLPYDQTGSVYGCPSLCFTIESSANGAVVEYSNILILRFPFVQNTHLVQKITNQGPIAHIDLPIRLIYYQRVSIASYASTGIARAEMSVCPSVRHTPVLYQNEES